MLVYRLQVIGHLNAVLCTCKYYMVDMVLDIIKDKLV